MAIINTGCVKQFDKNIIALTAYIVNTNILHLLLLEKVSIVEFLTEQTIPVSVVE